MNPLRDITEVLFRFDIDEEKLTIKYKRRALWEVSNFVYLFIALFIWAVVDYFYKLEFGIIAQIILALCSIPILIVTYRRREIKDQEMKTPILKLTMYNDSIEIWPTKKTIWSELNDRAGKAKESLKFKLDTIHDFTFYSIGQSWFEDEYLCIVAVTDDDLIPITPCFYNPSNCMKFIQKYSEFESNIKTKMAEFLERSMKEVSLPEEE